MKTNTGDKTCLNFSLFRCQYPWHKKGPRARSTIFHQKYVDFFKSRKTIPTHHITRGLKLIFPNIFLFWSIILVTWYTTSNIGAKKTTKNKISLILKNAFPPLNYILIILVSNKNGTWYCSSIILEYQGWY